MEVPSYHYEPLSNEDSFRLFRISRNQPDPSTGNQIQINLFEADFRDSPSFHAISYAWGQDDPGSAVLCNGQALFVTPNVEAILRMLAREESDVAFWIDSICIDQDSVPEKNIQVPKMRSIYSEASLVWVWLGSGTYETLAAITFLAEVSDILKSLPQSTEYGLYTFIHELYGPHAKFAEKVRASRGFYDAVDTNFIVDLLNLSWFHRTWTVQELVLARNAILVCGSVRIAYPNFLDALQKLQNHESARAHLTSRSNPASFNDETQCYRTLAQSIRDLRNPKISVILRTVRSKSSSKPEDKVYGLYGIFDKLQIQNLPRVDYSRPVHTTFTQITTTAIEMECSLDVLYSVCLPRLIDNLPSWVPDWYFSPVYEVGRLLSMYLIDIKDVDSILPTKCYKSSRMNGVDRVYIRSNRLTVKGKIIDKISEVATSTSIAMPSFRRGYNARIDVHETDKRRTGVLELVKTIQAWIRLSRKLQTYPTDTPPLIAFQETILHNSPITYECEPQIRESSLRMWMDIITANFEDSSSSLRELHNELRGLPEYDATVTDYSRVFEQPPDVESWPEELQIRLILRLYTPGVASIQHDIFLNTYHKTFLISRDGYIGICPRWARAGDLIALISGLAAPFIVRREEEHHTLIGPAYIHGVMKGERWTTEGLEDITFV